MSRVLTPVEPDLLREQMRHWTTGVTIVTSAFDDMRHGMTVSSFTSISLDPPCVLVSLARQARTYRLIEQSGIFGVTLLALGQQDISERFAGGSTEDDDRFAGLGSFTLATGAPFLQGGLACFDCVVRTRFDVGDNAVLIGEVVALAGTQDDVPLIYYNRAYRRVGRSQEGRSSRPQRK